MFDNIGGKIKSLAQVVTVIGIIASIIIGLIFMANAGFIGFIVMAIGILFSWISSFITYGLGQLIENTDTMVYLLKNNDIKQIKSELKNKGNTENTSSSTFDNGKENEDNEDTLCPHCGRKIIIPEETTNAYCPWCNKKIF